MEQATGGSKSGGWSKYGASQEYGVRIEQTSRYGASYRMEE